MQVNFWACGRNPMVWPFNWNLFGSTFTWYYLFLNILQNEIRDVSWLLVLDTLGSWKLTAYKTSVTKSRKCTENKFIRPLSLFSSHRIFSWNSNVCFKSVNHSQIRKSLPNLTAACRLVNSVGREPVCRAEIWKLVSLLTSFFCVYIIGWGLSSLVFYFPLGWQ